MTTIEITVGDPATGVRTGTRTISAEVIGPFAIHVHPENGLLHGITHVATGYRVCAAASAAQARAACRDFLGIKGVSWNFTDPKEVDGWPKAARELAGDIARRARA